MALLEIWTIADREAFLRQRAKPVMKITDKTRQLIDDMIETMYEAAGVGLAAPQVGVGQRIFVWDIGQGADALINPEILVAEGEELGVEGCLSIPRLHGEVPRAQKVIVSGLNRSGRRVRIETQDSYLARVFQHEIDHLNGILFTDKAIKESLHWISEEEEAERKSAGKERRGRKRILRRRAEGAAAIAAPVEE